MKKRMTRSGYLLSGVLAEILLATAMLFMLSCRGEPENPAPNDPVTEESGTADPSGSDSGEQTRAEETSGGHLDGDDLFVAVRSVYPVPQNVILPDGSTSQKVPAIPAALSADGDAAPYAALLREWGFLSSQENALPVRIAVQDMSDLFASGAEEGYELVLSSDGVCITAGSDRGVYYALVTLSQLAEDGKLPCLTVRDAPAVPERGVIEGFYGAAYTTLFRKELFAFMGHQKMNTYIYAPKDDAKHRSKWRELYTAEELEELRTLIDSASQNRVRFVYAISPGGDIRLDRGYKQDFAKLTAKCEQLYEIGVRDFAVLLDDIPTLNAEGHAGLLNDFQEQFVRTHEGVSDLICITTEYTDPMLTAYTDQIAPLLNPDLRLMWTGPGVVPASIRVSDLQKINAKYGRKVYLWWNYPVNDVLVDHLYMAPCQGLDQELAGSICGFVANPMNQGHASLYPLFTVADYLWNPVAYNQEASIRAAAAYLAPDAGDAALTFVDMVGACPQNGNKSTVALGKLVDEWRASGEDPKKLKPILEMLERMSGDLQTLRRADAALNAEAGEWFDKAEAYCRMAICYFEAEQAYAAGQTDTVLAQIGNYSLLAETVSDNRRVVSPDVLTPLIAGLTQRINVLAGIAQPSVSLRATAITNANHYMDYTVDRICDGDDSTYFWSHGAMWQAAPGTTGYVGLDFGEVVHIYNLYIATGENGGDVFTHAAIEYSTDQKTWTTICEGQFGEQIYLESLSFDARYVRMRNTDTSATGWVKVRVFEANTNRTVAAIAGKPGISTTLTTYQDYVIDRVTDGNADTYFWAARAVVAGDYVMMDLGAPCRITGILLETGVGGHSADYMQHAQLQYSADGYVWTALDTPGQGRATYEGLEITARYVRLIATADQTNWFTMSEFTVLHDPYQHPLLSSDDDFLSPADLCALTDHNVLTGVTVPAGNKGKTLTVLLTDAASVCFFIAGQTDGEAVVTLYDANGKKLSAHSLSSGLHLDVQDAATAVITFGNSSLTLSEILF